MSEGGAAVVGKHWEFNPKLRGNLSGLQHQICRDAGSQSQVEVLRSFTQQQHFIGQSSHFSYSQKQQGDEEGEKFPRLPY